jgi:hypothetical protein
MKIDSRVRTHVVSIIAAAGMAAATRWALRKAWTAGTGREPPDNPAEPGVTWQAAIAWGAASGIAAGVARILAHRLTTAAEA